MRQLVPWLPFAAAFVSALPAQAKVDFGKEVAPILIARCVDCHGATKQKGKLRLDRKADVFAEGREHVVVVPGDAEAGELLHRVQLPANDEDVMPAEGSPLSAAQIATLKAWVLGGAEWPDNGDALFAAAAVATPTFALPKLTAEQSTGVQQAVAALTARGILAQRVAADTEAVDVNLSLLRGKAGDAELAALTPLQPVLVWLNLARTAVTSDGLAKVAALQELRRLDLSNTALGDAALAHVAALPHLEVLNLYGTKVTDAGLGSLRGLTALRRLYLWQTAVTAEGAAALQKQLPQLVIDRGDYAEARLQAAAAAIAQRDQQNQPVNTTCPVTGKPIDPHAFVLHDGLRIAFCCQNCLAEFQQAPGKFAAKIAEYKAARTKPAK